MKIEIIYVDAPFWRAELARMPLFIGDVNFFDNRISSDEFQEAKITGKLANGTILPFHQIPCLVVDGTPIAQTGAIARFCGKVSGLYPVGNDINAALIDQFIDFVTDITVLTYIPAKRNLSDAEKIKIRQELAVGELKNKLEMLEKNIPDNCAWIVGNQMTIADIAIWRGMGWLGSDAVVGLPQPFFTNFPKIRRIFKAVDSHPKVLEWVNKTYPKDFNTGYLD